MYQSAVETLIDVAKEGLADKGLAVQASNVLSFMRDTQPRAGVS